jgi:hypothetical protein
VRIPGERAAYLDPDRSLKITAGHFETLGLIESQPKAATDFVR